MNTATLQAPLGALSEIVSVISPTLANELPESLALAVDEMTRPSVFELAGGRAAAFTQRSPGKSSPNEDVAALIPLGPRHGVLIVADGLGGHAQGEQASQVAVETFVDALERVDSGTAEIEGYRTAILNGIEAANAAVLELGNGSASTLAIAEIDNGNVRTYHVGDSAILLTGGRGRLKFQTIAHSPIGYAVEAGLLNESDAMHHEDRHVISNVIGATDMRIEIGPPTPLAPRDTLLLASDGLFDNLMPKEIVSLVRTGPIGQAVARLANLTVERMLNPREGIPSKPDDLTMIAFRLS
jgi:serine/threonine protein phosphatase PrpC